MERVAAVHNINADSGNCIDPNAGSDLPSFKHMSSKDQVLILLGKRFGSPVAEDSIDRLVKRFLTKAWNARAPITTAMNGTFGKSYKVFVAPVR